MPVRAILLAVMMAGVWTVGSAQTPVPFPRPGDSPRPAPPMPSPGSRVLPPQSGTTEKPGEPTEQTLGLPIYPGAQFIASYDAGRGQRYYLFGTNVDFMQIVTFYKSVLKQKGELVYEEPPVHMFDVGRFREESMAFPPGVSVKDYTWAGSAGYLVPKPGGQPVRYKTIIQLVPAPAAAAVGR
jgi:hypothetical protein